MVISRRSWTIAWLALLFVVVGLAPPASAVPPSNDGFADATVIQSDVGSRHPVWVQGETTEATREPGEPVHHRYSVGTSVWYSWTPSQAGRYAVGTCYLEFDSVISVYTGESLDALTLVGENDDATGHCGFGLASYLELDAAAGTTYRVAVDSTGNSDPGQGPFGLFLRRIQPPVNDDFADATVITGDLPVTTDAVDTADATTEPGEPPPVAENGDGVRTQTVWYRWTSAVNGRVRVTTCTSQNASQEDTALDVYVGSSLATLDRIASNEDGGCIFAAAVAFTAEAGTEYWIRVVGNALLRLRIGQSPANDLFADAAVLPAAVPADLDVDTSEATVEPYVEDGNLVEDGADVWFRWTPAVSETVTIDNCSFAVVTIYTGSAYAELEKEPSSSRPSECGGPVWEAVAGTTYSIKVGQAGRQRLVLDRVGDSPANDDFAAAATLQGSLPIQVAGTNLNADTEAGEPDHHVASVWYRWTPRKSGHVRVDARGSSSFATLDVYSGDSLSSLTPVRAGFDRFHYVQFTATAGTTYYITVGSLPPFFTTLRGLRLVIDAVQPPANDDLGEAVVVPPQLPATLPADNLTATSEPGESLVSSSGASVWFAWTAPSSGRVVAEVCGKGVHQFPLVFTGDSVTTLHPVPTRRIYCSRGERLSFDATAGKRYLVAVTSDAFDPPASGWQPARLTLRWASRPQNDDFAQAVPLPAELPATVTGSTADATHEDAEPPVDVFGRPTDASVWYSYTPAAAERLLLGCDADFAVTVQVFQGDSIEALEYFRDTGPGSDKVSPCGYWLQAQAGETLRFQVDGVDLESGAFELTLSRFTGAPPPGNDDFAASTVVAPEATSVQTTSPAFATLETGEPGAADPLGGSVWYSWTAPAGGSYVVHACDGPLDLGVFTGTAVGALTTVGTPYASCPTHTGDAQLIQTQAGTTYHFQLRGGRGAYHLGLRKHSPPVNDDLGRALSLGRGHLPLTVEGTTLDAGNEPFEERLFEAGRARTVWHTWTAGRTGYVAIDNCGSEATGHNPEIVIGTGSTPGSFRRVPGTLAEEIDECMRPSAQAVRATFLAIRGVTYSIGYHGDLPTPFRLNLSCSRNHPGQGDCR